MGHREVWILKSFQNQMLRRTFDCQVKEQWPPEPSIQMSKEEYLAMISEKLKNVKQPDDIDIEEIQRRIEEQYKKDKKRPFLVMRNGLLRM
jgi:hypothetical protein